MSLIVPLEGVQSWKMIGQREAVSPAEPGEIQETGQQTSGHLNDAAGRTLEVLLWLCGGCNGGPGERELQAFGCDFDQTVGPMPCPWGLLVPSPPFTTFLAEHKRCSRRLWVGGRQESPGLHPAFWMSHH